MSPASQADALTELTELLPALIDAADQLDRDAEQHTTSGTAYETPDMRRARRRLSEASTSLAVEYRRYHAAVAGAADDLQLGGH